MTERGIELKPASLTERIKHKKPQKIEKIVTDLAIVQTSFNPIKRIIVLYNPILKKIGIAKIGAKYNNKDKAPEGK